MSNVPTSWTIVTYSEILNLLPLHQMGRITPTLVYPQSQITVQQKSRRLFVKKPKPCWNVSEALSLSYSRLESDSTRRHASSRERRLSRLADNITGTFRTSIFGPFGHRSADGARGFSAWDPKSRFKTENSFFFDINILDT